MSTLQIEVCTIDEVKIHSNADSLDIVVVKGWQCVTKKGECSVGDKVVFFPPDTLLPESWTDKFGVTNYCSEKNNMRRVHRTRLRGEPSFGLVVRPPEEEDWDVETDVAEFYGAQKYEPPITCKVDNAAPDDPMCPKYTEIENMRNYPHVFDEGEEVILTEKIHGENVRIAIIDGEKKAGSRRLMRQEPEDPSKSKFWYAWSIPEVKSMMEDLAKDHKQVILYGEEFGPVQFLKYNTANKMDFRVFDLFIDGNFVDYDVFIPICEIHGVKYVPIVARIPYNLKEVAKFSEGQTLVNDAQHMREGIVARPVKERRHPKIDRVVLKYVSDTYLLGKSAKKDTTDV
ncbi:MAG TPA: RNA ligase family protein [Candidatus Glassbacteria bacterium]|nr:RNA ligase family protein [Candidatus Glassbacteria bacterium]